jgi:hypothetical protein
MTWNLIASTSATPGPSGGSTSSINTTGADLIVVEVSHYNAATPSFSDSKSNSWQQIGAFTQGAVTTSLYFSLGPTVGGAHTFSATAGGCYPAINVLAFSGSPGSGSYDQVSHATAASATSLAAGSITPSVSNSLIIATLGTDGGSSQTISVGTVQENAPWVNNVNEGSSTAYDEQSTAAAINPDWSWTGAANAAAIVVSFEPGSSGTSVTADVLAPLEFAETVLRAQPAGAVRVFLTSGSTWTVPANWNSANNTVEVVGDGGGGGTGYGFSPAAGGGAGGYAKAVNLALTPGQVVNIGIGAGGAGGAAAQGGNSAGTGANGSGTWFGGTSFSTALVNASGGTGGLAAYLINGSPANGGGPGGVGGGSAASLTHTGGAGGNNSSGNDGGSGGGGAAGPSGNGGAGAEGAAGPGSGGGGADGGTAGEQGNIPGSYTGGAGGNGPGGTGGGASVYAAPGSNISVAGNPGTAGTGGGGGGSTLDGESTSIVGDAAGNGATGSEWGSHGCGGGGGGACGLGNATATGQGGDAGNYGGGGGGGGNTFPGSGAGRGGNGAAGLIVVSFQAGGDPVEFLAAGRRDLTTPLESLGTSGTELNSDAIIRAEVQASPAADVAARLELAGTPLRDSNNLVESSRRLLVDPAIALDVSTVLRTVPLLTTELLSSAAIYWPAPIEWSGGVLVERDALMAPEWSARLRRDIAAAVETVAVLAVDQNHAVEWVVTTWHDNPGAAEVLSRLLPVAELVVELSSGGIVIVADSALLIESVGTSSVELFSVDTGPNRVRLLTTPGRIRLLRRN